MSSVTDQQLLADYTERQAESAFAELVRRHIDLVYSAALRMVQDSRLAEDVTQGAFIALANNASKLLDRPVLSGWLYRTAQNLAANIIRSDRRRRARERKAAAMNELLSSDPGSAWDEIAPHLDAALGELNDSDRDAVLLRYFDKKSAQEIGGILGVSAEAAQKRVSRAVERLRQSFAARGVAVGASGLAVITANAVQAAPAGLSVSISSAAAVAGTVAAPLTAATLKTIAMTAMQKTVLSVAVVALAGAGIYETRQAWRLRDQVNAFEQQEASQAGQIQRLRRERDLARDQLASLRKEQQRMPDETAELLRLRGMAGLARRAVAEAEQLRAELARKANEAADSPVTAAMADAMAQAMDQQVEGRLSRMTASLELTPEQVQAAREILKRQARAMSAGMQQAFTGKFNKEELDGLSKEAGNPDEQIQALLTSEQQASYSAYQQEEAAYNAGLAANQELLEMQTTLGLNEEQMDRVYAALYESAFEQLTGGADRKFASQHDAMKWAQEQKARALEPFLTEIQMENYRKKQALQAQLVKDILEKMERSSGAK